jgi:hypothetical protein
MEKKIFILNTDLVPLAIPDTYEKFNPDEVCTDPFNVYDSFVFHKRDVNMDELHNMLIDITDSYLHDDYDKAFNKLGLNFIKAEGFFSPREYNFYTDSINLKFEFLDDFEETAKKIISGVVKNSDCIKFMKNNYESCDGFMSFMPQDMDEFEEMDITSDHWLAAYIMLGLIANGDFYPDYENNEEYDNMVMERLDECIDEECLIDDSLADLYFNNEAELDILYWQLYFTYGTEWRHFCKRNKDLVFEEEGYEDNNAHDFIWWAQSKGYKLADLRRLAAETEQK